MGAKKMRSSGCVFCSIISGKETAAVVYEDDFVFAFLDKRPLFPGHTLLLPRNHISKWKIFLLMKPGICSMLPGC